MMVEANTKFRKITKETQTGLVSNIKKRFDCVIKVEVRAYQV